MTSRDEDGGSYMDRQNRWSVLRDVHLHGRLIVVRSSVTSTNSSTADAGGRSRSASHQSRPSFGSNRSIVGGKPKLNSFRFREGRARLERLESDPQDRDQNTRPTTAESSLPEAITWRWMRHHHHLSTGSSFKSSNRMGPVFALHRDELQQ